MKEQMRVVLEVMEGAEEGRKDEMEQSNEFLNRYLDCDKICIQCHDNPDADALASGYALYCYYKSRGIDVRFIYSGSNRITKSNLILMIKELKIPIEYVTELPECDLLMTTDCQYGAGNVTLFEAPKIAMIDHHQCGLMQNENVCIKSNLGSCATVVWSLLRHTGYRVSDDINVSTALYYGLYMDTSQFEEIYHPLDKDMRDELPRDEMLLFRLMNTNLSLTELTIASTALTKRIYNEQYHFSVIPSGQCDPNILGIISDFVIQVEEMDACVAFNPNPGGYKLSVRSCIKEAKANELAEFLCEGIGNGGGHLTKAGGFIALHSFEKAYPGMEMAEYLSERIRKYFDSYTIIYAKNYEMDKSTMKQYLKKPLPVGVVVATDFLKEGTPVLIRTLEGDVDVIVEDDLYFMIGIEGEVYPIRKEKFERTYRFVDAEADMKMEYAPTVRNNIDGAVYQLMERMRTCVAAGETKIYAKELDRNVKIFTAWDENKYYRGVVGDFIAMREDDVHDIYVVRRDIFLKTYEEID